MLSDSNSEGDVEVAGKLGLMLFAIARRCGG